MSIATIKSNITRKVHELAVGLHIAALRGEVKAANVEARAARKSADIAAAAAAAALALEEVAERGARYAAINAANVKTDAAQEAINIGGTL